MDNIEIKILDSKHVKNLIDLIKRCYGMTYFYKNFYCENYIKNMIDSNIIKAVIAVNSNNKIIGHITLFKNEIIGNVGLIGATDKCFLGEPAMLMIDPNYRKKGIANRLIRYLLNNLNLFDKNLKGLFCPPISKHVYSQLLMYKNGFKDCGCLICYYPKVNLSHLNNNNQRTSLLLTYLPINMKSVKTIYLPPLYKDIIKYIFNNININVIYIEDKDVINNISYNKYSSFYIKIHKNLGNANIIVKNFGNDFLSKIKYILKILISKDNIKSVLLFLSLNVIESSIYIESLINIGFVFAGVLSDTTVGEALILQYINVEVLDINDIKCLSEESKYILKYIKKMLI
ncbi:MAG: GNAT family N-acetyltransferase [Megamonas funiformis]|uniref:GNAT family N-acetyltransferase n=1 Tax=Megamonas funiformis TaxID=437897 RepID=UPI0039933A40